MADTDRLYELAGRVSDGEAVDWTAMETECGTPDEREAVRGLRLLAAVAGAQRPPDPVGATTAAARARWGSLELVEKIGDGAFAEVWRARDPHLDREVALKLFAPDPRTASGGERDVLAEGRMLARVRHPNVVTVHGAEVHGGRVGIWMELVGGTSLADRLREHGPLGSAEAALVGADVCRALAAVHAAGLVHGDVKAQNVLREEGGRIVLADFGAGRVRDVESTSDVVSGTPLYFAPEMLRAGRPSASGDLYAAGVLLYHLVTRSFPVKARSVDELAEKHRAGVRQRLRDARPDLPEAFVRVVERALAADPADRYPTAGAMEQALLGAVGAGAHSRRAHRLWLALGVAGVAVAVAWWVFGARAGVHTEATLVRVGESDVREVLPAGTRIAPGDRLALEIKANRDVWVYVVNEDERGHAFVLFPLPGLDLQNPLRGGEPYRLPGTKGGQARFWGVDTAGGREHFLIVASATRAGSFESALALLPPPDPSSGAFELDPASKDALLRGVGALVEPPQSGDPHAAASLFEMARALERSGGSRRDVDVHEITLENPAVVEGP